MKLVEKALLYKPRTAATAIPYFDTLKTIQSASMLSLLKLDEIGTYTFQDATANNHDAVCANDTPITYNNVIFTDGTVAPTWEVDVGSLLGWQSAGLIAAMGQMQEGSFACWFRLNVGLVARWSDSTQYTLFSAGVDINNRLVLCKGPTANTLRIQYTAGGTIVTVDNNVGTPDEGWHSVVYTWHKASDRIRVYLDKALLGNVGTGLGNYTGTTAAIYVGRQFGASTNWWGWIKYPTLWNKELAQADVNAYGTIVSAKPSSNKPQIFFVGDSISSDVFLAPGSGWPMQCMTTLTFATWDAYYYGVPSTLLSCVNHYVPTDIVPFYRAARSKNIVILHCGTNDIKAHSAATAVYNLITTFAGLVKAAGFKCIVTTILPRSDVTGADETNRQTVNTNLTNNWATFADGFVDFAGIANLQDPSNTTYYQTGGVHPTAAGHTLMKNAALTVIQAQ